MKKDLFKKLNEVLEEIEEWMPERNGKTFDEIAKKFNKPSVVATLNELFESLCGALKKAEIILCCKNDKYEVLQGPLNFDPNIKRRIEEAINFYMIGMDNNTIMDIIRKHCLIAS